MFYKQESINKYVHKNSLLALEGVLLTGIGTVEKLSIEELNSYHSKDKVEEQVDDKDVEDVFQRVDDTVEDCLQLGNPFDIRSQKLNQTFAKISS